MDNSLRDANYYFRHSIVASSLNDELKQQTCVLDASVIWEFPVDMVKIDAGEEFRSMAFRLPCMDEYKLKLTAMRTPSNSCAMSLHRIPIRPSFQQQDNRSMHVGIYSTRSRRPGKMIHFKAKSSHVTSELEDEEMDLRFKFTAMCNIRLEDFKCLEPTENQEPVNLVQILSDDLTYLQTYPTFSDLLIHSRFATYEVHKFILDGRCTAFRWMIGTTTDSFILADDILNPLDFLLYIYTGKMQSFEIGYIIDFYESANRYLILSLREYCSKFISVKLNLDVVLKVYRLSNLFGDLRLKNRAIKFMLKNYCALMESEAWQNYSGNSHRLIDELTSRMRTMGINRYLSAEVRRQNAANEGRQGGNVDRDMQRRDNENGLNQRRG